MTIPAEKVNDYATRGTEKLNCALKELRRLFMVENMLDSIKFGLSLWVLTYIGSWFNAMTLLIMGWVGLFSVPKVSLSYTEKVVLHFKMCVPNRCSFRPSHDCHPIPPLHSVIILKRGQ